MLSRGRVRRALVPVRTVVALVVLAVPHAAGQERSFGEVEVFTRVGEPGQPEGIALDSAGDVYVSTNNRGKGDADAPSRIFRYSPDGELVREYVVEGQNLDGPHGVLGLAFDADDRLYALDYDPPRVLRIDPATGRQETYATFPDLPRCADAADDEPCEPSQTQDQDPWPNWPVFDADGNLYVTDLHQATIFRIPPGGEPEVWHQSADYESIFSLNGQQFDENGDLVFVLTGSMQPGSPTRGHIYRLDVNDDGSPGEVELLYETLPAEGPDGLAIGESGRIYVALVTTHHILVLEPDGTEFARVPGPVENQQQEIPFDSPASIAFRDTSILVTNHAYFTEDEDSWAVLDMEVEEHGLPLHRPHVTDAAVDEGNDDPAASPDPQGSADAAPTPVTGGSPMSVAIGLLAAGFLVARIRAPRRTTPRRG